MKKLVQEINVICKECNNNIHIENEKDIKVMPVGYKGNYKFYVYCKRCGHSVTIEKEVIPKTLVRKLKLGNYF